MSETVEPSESYSEAGPRDGPSPAERMSQLEARLAEQGARLDEVLRAYSRLQQDHEDFRRRLERERDRVVEVERGRVALGLIEAVDELDRSLAAAPPECAALVDGVRLIRDGLLRRALASGITRQPALGETFDANLHEAVELVTCERPRDDGRIVEELRAGYRQGDRVLRPAQVRVGRFPRPPPPSGVEPRNHRHGNRGPGQE